MAYRGLHPTMDTTTRDLTEIEQLNNANLEVVCRSLSPNHGHYDSRSDREQLNKANLEVACRSLSPNHGHYDSRSDREQLNKANLEVACRGLHPTTDTTTRDLTENSPRRLTWRRHAEAFTQPRTLRLRNDDVKWIACLKLTQVVWRQR